MTKCCATCAGTPNLRACAVTETASGEEILGMMMMMGARNGKEGRNKYEVSEP